MGRNLWLTEQDPPPACLYIRSFSSVPQLGGRIKSFKLLGLGAVSPTLCFTSTLSSRTQLLQTHLSSSFCIISATHRDIHISWQYSLPTIHQPETQPRPSTMASKTPLKLPPASQGPTSFHTPLPHFDTYLMLHEHLCSATI